MYNLQNLTKVYKTHNHRHNFDSGYPEVF